MTGESSRLFDGFGASTLEMTEVERRLEVHQVWGEFEKRIGTDPTSDHG